MLRTPAQVRFRKAPLSQKLLRWVSTRKAQSSAFTWTQIQSNTASCVLVAAKSPSSIHPGPPSPTPNAIDLLGNIAGFYFDANSVGHGILRDSASATSPWIDAPGADHTAGSFNGTFAVGALFQTGEVEGVYVDINGVLHGFIRSPRGQIHHLQCGRPRAQVQARALYPKATMTSETLAGKLLRRQRRESWLRQIFSRQSSPRSMPRAAEQAQARALFPSDNSDTGPSHGTG